MTKRNSVAQGAMFTLATRWADRLIGIVSTIILARLLVPADFGVIAMASLVIALVDVLLDLGVNVALIKNTEATQADYNTAWTLRLAQTTLAMTIVMLSAPLAASYFNDARIEPVLRVLSLSFVLRGLENIGTISFQKEMRFGRDFQFVSLRRLAGFVVTIAAAYVMRSYWALVVGALTGSAIGVMLSYLLHPMRPRLSLEKAREIFGVSQWMILRGIAAYLERYLHRIIVGGRESASVMGAYTIADEIASLPSATLLAPLNRVLFPAFVAAKHELAELKRLFLLAQGIQVLIGMPAAVGLALVADEAVRLLLGEKWLAVIPVLQVFSVVSVVVAIVSNGGYVLITLGYLRSLVAYAWVRIGLFAAVAFLVLPTAGALEIAWLRAAFAMLGLVTFTVWMKRAFPGLRYRELVASIGRPLIAIVVMSAAVFAVAPLVDAVPLLVRLSVKVATGVASYTAAIMLLWWIFGRPSGAESYLLDKVRGRR